jgi:hypothetical protein
MEIVQCGDIAKFQAWKQNRMKETILLKRQQEKEIR